MKMTGNGKLNCMQSKNFYIAVNTTQSLNSRLFYLVVAAIFLYTPVLIDLATRASEKSNVSIV